MYIAQSIDGFIAREDGSVDWLDAVEHPENEDYGYAEFYSRIDTIFMGRKTYEIVLGFGVEWPYTNVATYVFSRNSNINIVTPETELISEELVHFTQEVMKGPGKDAWLIGGQGLIRSFMNAGLVDELIISVIPSIIGRGIPLFTDLDAESQWLLLNERPYSNGVVVLHYTRQEQKISGSE